MTVVAEVMQAQADALDQGRIVDLGCGAPAFRAHRSEVLLQGMSTCRPVHFRVVVETFVLRDDGIYRSNVGISWGGL
jgi:hypothetical protein